MAADIRPFNTDIRDKDSELERAWKKRKKIRRIIIITAAIAIAVFAITAFLVQRFYKYKDYSLVSEKTLYAGSFAGMERFGSNILKYSHDGASYIDISGNEVWVDSYEMRNPRAYVNGGWACISDAGGNLITIYNSDGLSGTINTNMPVTKAVISESGIVAAILEDKISSYINFYRKDGSDIDISIKSVMDGEGYPTDIGLSPDGSQLIAAFSYIESGAMKSRVVFYDFSEIGKNIPNRLVGGFEGPFENSLIAKVRFINRKYSYAVADTGIYFFSSENLASPELIKEITFEDNIESVFSCGDKVGVITENSQGEEKHRLLVYSSDGEVSIDMPIEYDYNMVSGDGEYIYLSCNDRCVFINMSGTVKADIIINDQPRIISEGKLLGRFVFSDATYIREYRLR